MVIHNKLTHVFPYFNPNLKKFDINKGMCVKLWGSDECIEIKPEEYRKEGNIVYIKPQNDTINKVNLITFQYEIVSGTVYFKDGRVGYIKEYC